jgi:hypothetical protein
MTKGPHRRCGAGHGRIAAGDRSRGTDAWRSSPRCPRRSVWRARRQLVSGRGSPNWLRIAWTASSTGSLAVLTVYSRPALPSPSAGAGRPRGRSSGGVAGMRSLGCSSPLRPAWRCAASSPTIRGRRYWVSKAHAAFKGLLTGRPDRRHAELLHGTISGAVIATCAATGALAHLPKLADASRDAGQNARHDPGRQLGPDPGPPRAGRVLFGEAAAD